MRVPRLVTLGILLEIHLGNPLLWYFFRKLLKQSIWKFIRIFHCKFLKEKLKISAIPTGNSTKKFHGNSSDKFSLINYSGNFQEISLWVAQGIFKGFPIRFLLVIFLAILWKLPWKFFMVRDFFSDFILKISAYFSKNSSRIFPTNSGNSRSSLQFLLSILPGIPPGMLLDLLCEFTREFPKIPLETPLSSILLKTKIIEGNLL